MNVFQGMPASPGIAIGPLWIYRPIEVKISKEKITDPTAEWRRVQAAINTAGEQLRALEARALEHIGAEEAAIFEAHQLFLEDPDLLEQIEERIRKHHLNGAAAVEGSVEWVAGELEELDDPYFQARAADVRDVGGRLIRAFLGVSDDAGELPADPVIVVAEDLTPSDTVQFDKERLLGLITVRGGPTSHVAILARSLALPAVVSAPLEIDRLKGGASLILDGETGLITVDPEEGTLAKAREAQAQWLARHQRQLEVARMPAITQDGHHVEIGANIGGVLDAELAIEQGAEGVGLFRTEFLYLDRDDLPSEIEQVQAYKAVFAILEARPIVVRTLDIGGDKAVSYLGFPEEQNPFLGWRALRMARERPELLVIQLRALLRAGVGHDIRIMVPMVSSVEEVLMARAALDQAREELAAANQTFGAKVQFGIMVEIPSAALMAARIAPHVDFFSLGTNDLTQYTLAVDRTNEKVAYLASPFHPAVLALIQQTIEGAHAQGKWVGLCGELGGNPLATAILLGLGLDEISMAPAAIPAVKDMVRRLSLPHCQRLAQEALSMSTAAEVESLLKREIALINAGEET